MTESALLTDEELKKALLSRVSSYSPELQALEMRRFVSIENIDSLYDLSEHAIQATALLRALNDHIIEIPASLSFADNFCSLTRSRRRLGRQEAVSLANRPANSTPSEYDADVEGDRQYQDQKSEKKGFFKWFKG